MSKISWPNAASRCPTKRFGCGASRSVRHTLAGSRVDRAGWAHLAPGRGLRHHPEQRLVKTGARLVKHARYYWLLLAESHLTRRLFGAMLQRIWALPVPAD